MKFLRSLNHGSRKKAAKEARALFFQAKKEIELWGEEDNPEKKEKHKQAALVAAIDLARRLDRMKKDPTDCFYPWRLKELKETVRLLREITRSPWLLNAVMSTKMTAVAVGVKHIFDSNGEKVYLCAFTVQNKYNMIQLKRCFVGEKTSEMVIQEAQKVLGMDLPPLEEWEKKENFLTTYI